MTNLEKTLTAVSVIFGAALIIHHIKLRNTPMITSYDETAHKLGYNLKGKDVVITLTDPDFVTGTPVKFGNKKISAGLTDSKVSGFLVK